MRKESVTVDSYLKEMIEKNEKLEQLNAEMLEVLKDTIRGIATKEVMDIKRLLQAAEKAESFK